MLYKIYIALTVISDIVIIVTIFNTLITSMDI